MNILISKKIKWFLILGVVAAGIIYFYFPLDDIQYLKKKTVHLINLVGPISSATDFALLRRKQEIGKHIHVAVHFKVSVFQHKFEDNSLARLQAFLTDYFKYPNKNKWKWNIPDNEEFNYIIIEDGSFKKNVEEQTGMDDETMTPEKEHIYNLFTERVTKVAKMEFPVNVTNETTSASCQVQLYWIKEESWFIREINISNCFTS